MGSVGQGIAMGGWSLMHAVDEIAYASPFREWSPLGKLLFTMTLLVSSLTASSLEIPMIVALIGLVLLFLSSRMRFPKVIALALLEGLGIFVLGAVMIAFVTAGDTIWSMDLGIFVISLTKQGLELGALVFLRAVAGITVMLFFATSTPIPYLANALRQIRIPAELVELTVLVYRYSFLLLEQLDTMYVAAHSRLGFRGLKTKFRTTGKLLVGIFIRSMDMAERSQTALNCRSFVGEFHCYRPPAKMSFRWGIAAISVFLVLFSINLHLIDLASLGTLLRL
ncbi:MAG: Energy-coupling factor transporter transmembrane protein EcfT [Methanomassiliicoccales archaeon PtaU1.Bin030]|nr:MAG: Energy-coupling factor transporter transmembrane protein EcfT [Methanomassiliicoccales archaeon PtaU1.Bin030]